MIYSNFFRSKIDNFLRKIFDIFLIYAQNIDCGYTLEPPRRGGSNKYPQSMFWSKNKKNRYTPAYPSLVGFKGVFIARTSFPEHTSHFSKIFFVTGTTIVSRKLVIHVINIMEKFDKCKNLKAMCCRAFSKDSSLSQFKSNNRR